MNWTGLLALAPLVMVAGCVTPSPMTSNRQYLMGLLEKEMLANTGWVRIHAADALLDHRNPQPVAACFQGEAGDRQCAVSDWSVARPRAVCHDFRTASAVGRATSGGIARRAGAGPVIPAAETLARLEVKLPGDSALIGAVACRS